MSPQFMPHFHLSSNPESPQVEVLVTTLDLQPHIEGGFFKETDRAPDTVPSPFPVQKSSKSASELVPKRPGFNPEVRNSSTTIFYLLTPNGPQGGFHRNKGRTVHTLDRRRGRYILIYADEPGKSKRVESFVVGKDVDKGEKLQWIVEGGRYKASYLLPDEEGGNES